MEAFKNSILKACDEVCGKKAERIMVTDGGEMAR